MTASPAKTLYERLREVGFTKPYIRKVAALPTWWDDSLWEDPPSRAVGYMHLSRHLGIEITSLQNPNAPLRLKDFGVCKYKKQASITDAELLLSRVIATRAAQLAAAATERPYESVPSAADMRSCILEQAPHVGLIQLLDHCWAAGIPVLHISDFPVERAKRPMGFTLRVKDRPAIVLCLNKAHPAWHLFVLAHELGHIHGGHVPEDGSLLDQKPLADEQTEAGAPAPDDTASDGEEIQADEYAAALLTGQSGPCLATGGRWPNAKSLAEQAKDFGRRHQVDPGHAVLECANVIGGGFWGVANAALKILEPQADAIGSIQQRLAGNLDWERLPEDSSEFLMRITRQETPA